MPHLTIMYSRREPLCVDSQRKKANYNKNEQMCLSEIVTNEEYLYLEG